MSGFRKCGHWIYPINLSATDRQIGPSKAFQPRNPEEVTLVDKSRVFEPALYTPEQEIVFA